jgi:glutamate synthase domain-containing protein 2
LRQKVARDPHHAGFAVDGGEGTGAAPLEFSEHIGTPLQDALLMHNTLVGLNLRDKLELGAGGKIISAFDVARTLALGADWCNTARGFMFALSCVQSLSCHTSRCPTGVTTQDKRRQRANTRRALGELTGAAGLSHPGELKLRHIVRRVSGNEVRLVANVYR